MLYHQLYVHDSRASLRAVFTLLKYTMLAPFLGLNCADRVVGGPGVVAADPCGGWSSAGGAWGRAGGGRWGARSSLQKHWHLGLQGCHAKIGETLSLIPAIQAGMHDSAFTRWHAVWQECACRQDPWS